MKLPKFTLRDFFWFTLVCGIILAWYIDSGAGYRPEEFSKFTQVLLGCFK